MPNCTDLWNVFSESEYTPRNSIILPRSGVAILLIDLIEVQTNFILQENRKEMSLIKNESISNDTTKNGLKMGHSLESFEDCINR